MPCAVPTYRTGICSNPVLQSLGPRLGVQDYGRLLINETGARGMPINLMIEPLAPIGKPKRCVEDGHFSDASSIRFDGGVIRELKVQETVAMPALHARREVSGDALVCQPRGATVLPPLKRRIHSGC